MNHLELLKEYQEKKLPVLDNGFVRLVDVMGTDHSIVDAARVSYGAGTKHISDDRKLINYLYRHGHHTPFEMVEFKFHIRIPMDVHRQLVRHRTFSFNEYSTRYSIAIDAIQKTNPSEWRLQSKVNKQGSSGYLPRYSDEETKSGEYFSDTEQRIHEELREIYYERLDAGIAREQARKDLPLSTYTELYVKANLRNLFNFLSLRMDSHAQLEIRQYANIIYNIIKDFCPLAVDAFDTYDFRRNALLLSAHEVNLLKELLSERLISVTKEEILSDILRITNWNEKNREFSEAVEKLKKLGLIDDTN